MPTAVLAPVIRQRFFDEDGFPLNGGKLYSYVSGSAGTVNKDTWKDADEVAKNTNPIILDPNGYADIWLEDNGLYDFVMKDSLNNVKWTIEKVPGGPDTVLASVIAALDAKFSNPNYLNFDAEAVYAASSVGRKLQNFLSVTDYPFLAKCDGVTNDTAAVQLCITFANSFDHAITILVPGLCVVDSLVLNRPVDTKYSFMRFLGTGHGSGFKVTDTHTAFTSTLTGSPTGSPQSEKVGFDYIHFEAFNATDTTYVISKNFLRTEFNGCTFDKIKLGTFLKGTDAAGYAQQFIIRGGYATRWAGNFVDAFQAYDFNVNGIQMEQGAGGFNIIGGVFNLNICQTLFEGNSGTFIFIAGANQITLIGNYTEGNGGVDYYLTDIPNGGRSRAVLFSGNFQQVSVANTLIPAFWNVVCGDVYDMFASGNFCNYQMYDDLQTEYGRLVSIGDNAYTGALNRSGKPITGYPAKSGTTIVTGALAGTTAADATPITTDYARFTTGTGGAVLPTADYGLKGYEITVINYSPNSCKIWAKTGDSINLLPYVTLASGGSRTFHCTGPGIWNSLITTSLPVADIVAANVPAVVTYMNTVLLPALRDAGIVGQ